MSNLGQEKISHKVLRIVCLCLVVVVIGAVIGVYFLTKKSLSDTFKLYKEIVAKNIEIYDESSLFEKDRDIVAKYTKSEALELVVQEKISNEEVATAQQELNDAINGGDETQIEKAQIKYNNLKNRQYYNLLQTQYKQLLIYSNNYFDTFIEEVSKSNNSLSRSKMNNLYNKVKTLEAKIANFQKYKIKLEQKTNTGYGSSFDVSEANTLAVLREHMQSYVELINAYVDLNKTFVSVHVELNGLTNALNDYNAKIIINYAILYATSYFVISNYGTLTRNEQYFINHTNDELFTKISLLYNKSLNGVIASQDTMTYTYLYHRTKNIYSELDILTECAKKIKVATENNTLQNLDPIYQSTLDGGKQNVLTFLEGTLKVVA